MLVDIQAILMARGLVSETWAAEMEARGLLVKLFRDYYDGEHRAELTDVMRKMLRVKNNHLDRFNVNYCPLVVDAMADRLTVDTVEASMKETSPPSPLSASRQGEQTEDATDAPLRVPTDEMMGEKGTYQASIPTPSPSPQVEMENPIETWVTRTLECNRFDALQIDVREAALRDGDTFVMVQYSDEDKEAKFAHELAWDGLEGSMVVYDRMGKSVVAGVKIWKETTETRCNIYYPGEMVKYTAPKDGGSLTEIGTERTVRGMDVPSVPMVHFKNKGTKTRGSSELINVVPLQDGLNRTFVSMVMTAELSAFQIRTAKGFVPSSDLAPGMWIQFGHDVEDAALLGAMDAGVMEQAQLVPFIEEANFIIHQIGTVTYTPLPSATDTQSGEALKQREIGLLSKVRRAMVQLGNSWENVLRMAHEQCRVFGGQKLPEVEVWTTRWKDAQIRNDTDLVTIAEWYMKHGFEREALRVMSQSSLVNYSEADIDAMIEQKSRDSAAKMAMLRLPGMGRFNGVDESPRTAQPPQLQGARGSNNTSPQAERGNPVDERKVVVTR